MDSATIYQSDAYFNSEESFSMVKFHEFDEKNAVYHSHDFVEICYVYRGKGYHLIGGKRYRVYKGDLFIINYDLTHTFYCEKNEDLVTFNIMFNPSFLDKMLINLKDFNTLAMSYLFKDVWCEDRLQEDLRLDKADQKEFDFLINKMYAEYLAKEEGYMNIIRAYMIELIIKIMRCFSLKSESDTNFGKKALAVDSVIDFLHSNFSTGFNLEELALKTFFSKNYLCKIFKDSTGITISEYMQLLRIDEACRLLETTGDKITDIALDVGFSDYKSFNATFKRLKGITANQYRKINAVN